MQRTYQEAYALLPEADPTEHLNLVLLQEIMLAQLINEGAVYAAHCLARSEADPERLCTAEFSILIKEVELPPEQPLATIANGLREPGEPRAVATVTYPAGEAIVTGEELAVQPPMLPSGRPSTTTHRMRQARVLLPLPDRQLLAILGITSTDLADWPHFVRILNDIAHSVSFTEPATGTLTAALDGE